MPALNPGKQLHTFLDLLRFGETVYAKRQQETAHRMLHQHKRLLLLLFLSGLVSAGLGMAYAQELPPVLGGEKAYAPAYLSPALFLFSILIGLATGLMTGAIGVGGGFVITPALMSVGIRGILAVGTGMFYVFGTAIMGSAIHKKLGNISAPIAIAFSVGSFFGVNAGAGINTGLYRINPLLSDSVINGLYIVLLGFLGVYALRDFLRQAGAHKHGHTGTDSEITGVAKRLQAIKLPPTLRFDHNYGGRTLSAWLVAACGFVVGFMASIMGVGGGFLTFPVYVYGLGISPFTAVGTDTFQIIFTAGYASIFKYATYGFVFYSLAVGLLTGSLIGVQLGAMTTKAVNARHIKGFYAITILASFVNRLFAMPEKLAEIGFLALPKVVAGMLTRSGAVLFFIVIAFFAVWVLSTFYRSITHLRKAGMANVSGYSN